jgi:uncharacterized repeat protein (TIGR02543 family)
VSSEREGANMRKIFLITMIIAAICLSGCPELEDGKVSEYIVTFDLCGGNSYGDTALIRIPVYEAQTIKYLPIPERENYTFGGWFTKQDGQGDEFTNTTHVYANMTVYAKWNN